MKRFSFGVLLSAAALVSTFAFAFAGQGSSKVTTNLSGCPACHCPCTDGGPCTCDVCACDGCGAAK